MSYVIAINIVFALLQMAFIKTLEGPFVVAGRTNRISDLLDMPKKQREMLYPQARLKDWIRLARLVEMDGTHADDTLARCCSRWRGLRRRSDAPASKVSSSWSRWSGSRGVLAPQGKGTASITHEFAVLIKKMDIEAKWQIEHTPRTETA